MSEATDKEATRKKYIKTVRSVLVAYLDVQGDEDVADWVRYMPLDHPILIDVLSAIDATLWVKYFEEKLLERIEHG